MKKTLLILLAFLPILSCAQIGKTYHVKAEKLNLRSEPTTEAEIIDKLEIYDNVVVLNDSIKPGWYQVNFSGKKGYVSASNLQKGKSIVSYYTVRTGAVCKDGTSSTATGRGACSHHGGVAYWKTDRKRTVQIVDE